MAIVPVDYPGTEGVDKPSLYSGRPVLHGAPMTLAATELYLAGYMGRRWTHAIAGIYTALVDGYPPNGNAHNGTHSLLLPTTPHAQHIYLRIDAAAETQSTGVPSVQAQIRTLAGINLDVGVLWTRSDQTFPTHTAWVASARRNGIVTLTTGTSTIDGAAGGGAPTAPRMLYLGSNAGSELELNVIATNAWVLSISACEYWEASL